MKKSNFSLNNMKCILVLTIILLILIIIFINIRENFDGYDTKNDITQIEFKLHEKKKIDSFHVYTHLGSLITIKDDNITPAKPSNNTYAANTVFNLNTQNIREKFYQLKIVFTDENIMIKDLKITRNNNEKTIIGNQEKTYEIGDFIPLVYHSCYINKTLDGDECQKWVAPTPSPEDFNEQYADILSPALDGEQLGNHNFCRNPSMNPKGPWCYTKNKQKPIGNCEKNISICNEDNFTTDGKDYFGCQNTAKNGNICLNWSEIDSQLADFFYDNKGDSIPDKFKNHNFCRKKKNLKGKPFCFTANGNDKVISVCDNNSQYQIEYNDNSGYIGKQNKTIKNTQCIKWNDFNTNKYGYKAEHNFCRDPDPKQDNKDTHPKKNRIWCYTDKNENAWNYCNPLSQNACN